MSTWTNDQLDARVQQPDVATLTDAAAATAICADVRTVSPIPLLPLLQWLSSAGLKARIQRTTSSAAFTGVCQQQGMTAAQQQATADKVDGAIAYILSGGTAVIAANSDTFAPPDSVGIASQTNQLLGLMQACNVEDPTVGMTAAEVTAFLSFGGGVPFGAGSVVTADVTASRARLANAQNYNLAAQLGSHQYNAYAAWLSSQIAAKATAPTTAQCLSFLGTQQP